MQQSQSISLADFEKNFKNEKPKWKEILNKVDIDPVKEGWKQAFNGKVSAKNCQDAIVKIYTKKFEGSDLFYTFQDIKLHGLEFDKFLKLSNDIEKRKLWDKKVNNAEVIKKLGEQASITYMAINMPFLMTNRDFLLERRFLHNKDHSDQVKQYNLPDSKETYMLNYLSSIDLQDVPPKQGFIRAETTQYAIYRQVDKDTIHLTSISHADMKGSIPHFLLNAGAAKGAQSGLKVLLEQYRDLNEKGQLD